MSSRQKRERQGGRAAGRAGIQAAMQTEFQRAGVWDLLRKRIAASEYTRVGDPLKIDLGYRSSIGLGTSPAGVIRMFHAVSLEAGVENGQGAGFFGERSDDRGAAGGQGGARVDGGG